MKKAISLILFVSMCFCLTGFCFGEAPMTKAKANAAKAGAGIAQARVAGREDWEPEDMFGDWSGTTKGDEFRSYLGRVCQQGVARRDMGN